MPIAKAVTWLIAENPCTWQLTSIKTNGHTILSIIGEEKASEVFCGKDGTILIGVYKDKSKRSADTKPDKTIKVSKEDFMKVLQSTVRWVGGVQ